jgi:hypothetical protein
LRLFLARVFIHLYAVVHVQLLNLHRHPSLPGSEDGALNLLKPLLLLLVPLLLDFSLLLLFKHVLNLPCDYLKLNLLLYELPVNISELSLLVPCPTLDHHFFLFDLSDQLPHLHGLLPCCLLSGLLVNS